MLLSKSTSTKNIKVSNLSTQFGGKAINNNQLGHIKGGTQPTDLIDWDHTEF